MKKLLTVLLVVAMMLSLSSVAFAAGYSDVADLDQGAQASIAKLNALNIINGYPDGTYKPANNITRAEFAKIACIAGGMGKSAEMLQGSPSKFSDVAAGQWYTGYINLANSQGWVKGFPDGTFRPNNQITYAEVITVLVRILGYNDNLPGPWPVDYIAKAGAIDITEDVSFDANAPATRGDVAVMTDATLDCEVVKWDNDTEDFEEQNYSLLEDKFETAVNEDYMVTSVEFDDDVWSIKVKATDDDDDALDGKWLDLADGCMVSDGSLPTGLGSKMVDILYNDDDGEVLYLEVTSKAVTVDGADWKITKFKNFGTSANPDEHASQYEIDGTKYDVADWVLESKSNVGDYLGVYSQAANIKSDEYYRALVNSDKDVYRVLKRNDDTPAIVDKYDDGELTVKDEGTFGDADIESIDFEDDDVLIEKDGAFVEATDLEENDVIYVYEDSYGYDYYIEVAGSISKTGVLQSYKVDNSNNATSMKIDGTSYDVADFCLISDDEGDSFEVGITDADLEDSDDETITYFLNKANQVCFVIIGEVGKGSPKLYGVVTDLGYRTLKGGALQINEVEVLKADGSETTYKVDTSEVELDDSELDLDEFIKFTVDEDNQIDSLNVLARLNGDGTVNSSQKIQGGNDDNNRIKVDGIWYTVNSSTVVFSANRANPDIDDPEVIANSDLIDWAADLASDVEAYVQVSGTKVEYIYVNEAIGGSAGADYALVLSKFRKGGKNWVKVDIEGTEAEYELKNNADVDVSCIYDYSISSNKFFATDSELEFDPETVSQVVYEVVSVDRAGNAVEVKDGATTFWLYAGEDTIVYDYTDYYGSDDDPEYASSIRAISKGDDIVFYGDEDEVDMFVIVTGHDE